MIEDKEPQATKTSPKRKEKKSANAPRRRSPLKKRLLRESKNYIVFGLGDVVEKIVEPSGRRTVFEVNRVDGVNEIKMTAEIQAAFAHVESAIKRMNRGQAEINRLRAETKHLIAELQAA